MKMEFILELKKRNIKFNGRNVIGRFLGFIVLLERWQMKRSFEEILERYGCESERGGCVFSVLLVDVPLCMDQNITMRGKKLIQMQILPCTISYNPSNKNRTFSFAENNSFK